MRRRHRRYRQQRQRRQRAIPMTIPTRTRRCLRRRLARRRRRRADRAPWPRRPGPAGPGETADGPGGIRQPRRRPGSLGPRRQSARGTGQHRRGGLPGAFAWIIVARAACFWFSGGVGWTCQRASAAILDCPIHAELIPRTGAARWVDTAHHIAARGVFTAGGGVQCCAAALTGETALHWWTSDAVEVSLKDAGTVPAEIAATWINCADRTAACSVGARAITVGRCARSTGRGAAQAHAI